MTRLSTFSMLWCATSKRRVRLRPSPGWSKGCKSSEVAGITVSIQCWLTVLALIKSFRGMQQYVMRCQSISVLASTSRTSSGAYLGCIFFWDCNPQNTKHDPPKRKYQTLTNLPKAIKGIMLHFMDPPRGTRTATKGRLAPVMGTSECWRTCQNHGEWQLKAVKWQFICHMSSKEFYKLLHHEGGHPWRGWDNKTTSMAVANNSVALSSSLQIVQAPPLLTPKFQHLCGLTCKTSSAG